MGIQDGFGRNPSNGDVDMDSPKILIEDMGEDEGGFVDGIVIPDPNRPIVILNTD